MNLFDNSQIKEEIDKSLKKMTDNGAIPEYLTTYIVPHLTKKTKISIIFGDIPIITHPWIDNGNFYIINNRYISD